MISADNYKAQIDKKTLIFSNLSYVYLSFSLAFAIILVFLNYYSIQYLNIINILACILVSLNLITINAARIYRHNCRLKIEKFSINECKKIINFSKINGTPKVVYVYTCRNDMVEQCLLNNIKQSYKNIEFWISDGSSDPAASAKIKYFAQNNNINYFKVNEIEGSKSKADNLNHFLKYSHITYDYLLITDSDEFLSPSFVENALKMFFCNTNKKIFYVSALNYLYKPTTIYGALQFSKWNNIFMNDYLNSVSNPDRSNLYSCSCLISKELLAINKGFFPDGSWEDMYLQELGFNNGLTGKILPISPCSQSPDAHLLVEKAKDSRIYDWLLKMHSKYCEKNYSKNHKFVSRSSAIRTFILPIFWIFLLIISPILIWIMCIYGKFFFKNYVFITAFAVVLSFIFISPLFTLKIDSKTHLTNKLNFLTPFFDFVFDICRKTERIKHWFIVIFKKRYSAFVPSNETTKKKNKLINYWIYSAICIVIITVLSVVQARIFGYCNIWINLGFVYGISISSFILAVSVFNLVLYYVGKISINKNMSFEEKTRVPDFYKNLEIQ